MKEGRAADWVTAVRRCCHYEPWKIEPFMAMRAREAARERPDDSLLRETIARAFTLLAVPAPRP